MCIRDSINAEYMGEAINNLPEGVADIKHEDWKNIINTVMKDDKLKNLKITSTLNDEKKASAICVADEKGNATAVFRGTGTYEWLDNGTGGYLADTEQQKKALAWIESLPYENITSTGHSKGGNKAQYVMILSDKVTRCVAYDGQGFGEEFCDKYKEQIEAKMDKITLISSQSDYVNILFFTIAGNVVYTKSDENTVEKLSGVKSSLEYIIEYYILRKKVPGDLMEVGIEAGREHMPNAFLIYKDGRVQFREITEQDPLLTLFHQYVKFVTKNASKEDKEYLFKLIMNELQGEKGRVDVGNPPDGFKVRMLKLSLEWIGTLDITMEQFKLMIKGKMSEEEINVLLSDIADQAYETKIASLTSTKRDFSRETQEKLIGLIRDVEGDNPLDFKKWPQWEALGEVRAKLSIYYYHGCLLYTSPSPRDLSTSRMPSSA
eukprot:TRINITY_DN2586_c0_g1_i4.p1 TRINITY_DN2586_c0_g1~~TRINITY_DN2586_c0_g1_i4.p1  ORF type:complete len:434 (+),score=69.56 TRINITY_DN2586_c0_g1_i4:198-1499(+)